MGELIVLSERRAARSRGARHSTSLRVARDIASSVEPEQGRIAAPPIALGQRRAAPHELRGVRTDAVAFFFDVACPFSYLAAERVERTFATVTWVPAAATVMDDVSPSRMAELQAAAEARAAELRLPLVWPEQYTGHSPRALRATDHACEAGVGARFAMALGRLAFCGGFDIEDPEVLAEAAAASWLKLDDCLAAAADTSRDGRLMATALGLRYRGVTALPAVRVGRRWFGGERGLAGAMAAVAG
jgi:2-hydroxychromene-2-carboxylate isomerase